MKNFLVNIIKLFISVVILIFAHNYFYKLLNLTKLHINSSIILNIIFYLLMALCIYIIYKDDLKSGFNRFKHKFGRNILYAIIYFLIIFISLIIVNYVCKVLASSFKLNYQEIGYLNIFNKTLNLDLLIVIIRDTIIIPFIMVSIFTLGVDNLFVSKVSIFFSGLLAGIYNAYIIGGSIPNMIINSVPIFALFMLLTIIYRRNNNIAFSIFTYIIYMLFAGILYIELW